MSNIAGFILDKFGGKKLQTLGISQKYMVLQE